MIKNSRIPSIYQNDIIEIAEKEYKKGSSTTAITELASTYLKTKEYEVSPRTIRRFLETRQRNVASAINTIVSTSLDIDLEKPKQIVDTVVSFLDDEVKKAMELPVIDSNHAYRRKEVIGWLEILDRYLDKQIRIATLTSAHKSESNSNTLEQGRVVIGELHED